MRRAIVIYYSKKLLRATLVDGSGLLHLLQLGVSMRTAIEASELVTLVASLFDGIACELLHGPLSARLETVMWLSRLPAPM